MSEAMLTVKDLQSWYGESHILHGVTFQVQPGEVVTLLGRNGVGKTTTLKSIMGIVRQRTGSVRFEGRETIGLQSDVIARCGIAFCPEERGIFSSLDVRENLLLPPQVRAGGLELRRLAFPHAYTTGTNMAAWLWNTFSEYALSHAISTSRLRRCGAGC